MESRGRKNVSISFLFFIFFRFEKFFAKCHTGEITKREMIKKVHELLPNRLPKGIRAHYHKKFSKLKTKYSAIPQEKRKENVQLLKSALLNFDLKADNGGGFVYCEDSLRGTTLTMPMSILKDLIAMSNPTEDGNIKINVDIQMLKVLMRKRTFELMAKQVVEENQR
jgi:hypothetical protein